MRKRLRSLNGRVGGVLLCLLLTSILGGVAFASPGLHANVPTAGSRSDQRSESPESPEQDEESESPEAPEQAGEDQASAQAHTAADCTAGLQDIQATLPPQDQATGLAHAIHVVEGNCEKNLQAPGLVIALGHLVTNYQRHLAHEADKAAGAHGNAAGHGDSAAHDRSEHPGQSEQDVHD
jgi:hypothetical protein